jgi:hypothetical protein
VGGVEGGGAIREEDAQSWPTWRKSRRWSRGRGRRGRSSGQKKRDICASDVEERREVSHRAAHLIGPVRSSQRGSDLNRLVSHTDVVLR